VIHLKELSDFVLDFDIEAIGFEPPEIDFNRARSSARSAFASDGPMPTLLINWGRDSDYDREALI
jgi:hypothetical protein